MRILAPQLELSGVNPASFNSEIQFQISCPGRGARAGPRPRARGLLRAARGPRRRRISARRLRPAAAAEGAGRGRGRGDPGLRAAGARCSLKNASNLVTATISTHMYIFGLVFR